MKARLLILSLLLLFGGHALGQPGDPTIDKQVAALIGEMLNKSTEHKAFAGLETLGCAAVPAIIKRMDDRRNLPDPTISLANKSPDAFEGYRHYDVEKVVDALDAILNQITGQYFGVIDTDQPVQVKNEARQQVVRGWRDWLKNTPPAKLCSGG
jgi:hypothetical protein